MPKIPEGVAAETVEAVAKWLEAEAANWKTGMKLDVMATALRDNRTTIIASVTKPDGND